VYGCGDRATRSANEVNMSSRAYAACKEMIHGSIKLSEANASNTLNSYHAVRESEETVDAVAHFNEQCLNELVRQCEGLRDGLGGSEKT